MAAEGVLGALIPAARSGAVSVYRELLGAFVNDLGEGKEGREGEDER